MADLLIGNSFTQVGSTPDDYAFYVQKTALDSGTVNLMKFYAVATSGTIDVAIYSTGGSLLTQGTTSFSSSGWNDVSVSDLAITASTDYILFMCASAAIGNTNTGTDYDVYYSGSHDPTSTSPPDPLSTWTWSAAPAYDIGLQAWGDVPVPTSFFDLAGNM